MRNIAVIGSGYVGLVSGTCFAEIGNRVICCDVDQKKIDRLQQGDIPIYEPGLQELIASNTLAGRLSFTTDIASAVKESEVVYIAVGTPMSSSGEADLQYIRAAALMIGEHLNGYKVIVNKSTVPVGTARLVRSIIHQSLAGRDIEFDVVSNPEFLREGSAIADCMNMDRAVIGATSEKAAQWITELHEPFHTTIFLTEPESAEMIKYAANAFLATKISFINAIANICEQVGADVTHVSSGMGLDSRIGSKFLQAGIGYGGSCFPKDTHALTHIASEAGYEFDLLKAVIATNDRQKLVVVDMLVRALGELAGRKIAVFGLAFKPNTDDIRDAPSLTIIPELVRKGAVVRSYDPIATHSAQQVLGSFTSYYADMYEAAIDCDACIILTEWQEVKNIDIIRLRGLLKYPIMIDGRNCFELPIMEQAGYTYYSIGRPPIVRA